MWMKCPLQAKFATIDRLPRRQNGKASFGTVIHHCLYEYNSGLPVEETVTLFKELWAHPERLGVAPDYWPRYTSYGGLREKGIELLRDYDKRVRWESREIVAMEHRFLVPMGEHELEGTVDHVEVRRAGNGRRTLRVVDHKTDGRVRNRVELRLDIQFTVYMWAVEQPEFWIGNGPDFPGLPNGESRFEDLHRLQTRAVWHHVLTGKEVDAGERDDGDYMRLYRLLTEVERAIDANVFVPNLSENCIYCDFVDRCGIAVPKEEELEIGAV
jgi:hypothetical protein